MDAIADLRAKGYYIAMLNGDKCRTEDAFYAEIAKAFKFPEGYGKNLDALNDCITDLSWLDEHNYALVIFNEPAFLCNASKGRKDKVIDVFDDASKAWSEEPGRAFLVLMG